ncbi:MAG: glycoside hydrolase family 13 protein [Weeksellaceae bacterium]|nr:glycoside hydrolase family 13 protein [Weeksellaceae bacterium]
MKSFLLLFALVVFQILNAQEIRIEPPNWWTNMQHDTVQILLYSSDIGQAEFSTKSNNIKILQQHSAENSNYKFLDIAISRNAIAGDNPISYTTSNGAIRSINFPLMERSENSAQRQGFDNSDAVYLIVPDRFVNANPQNDNIPEMVEKANRDNPEGRHGGDIAGIQQSLDYIANLGFTAIWPTPMLENNRKSVSYHGYGITDFYRIDPRFGSNLEFKNLVATARKHDIKIIQDFVLNHCGDDHWWMQDLPFADWINTWPQYTQTNHKKSVAIDPYVSDIDRETYLRGWFVPSMPDLNQQNPYLAKYLIQNAIWWIEYSGINGIRVDTYSYSDPEFMAQWNKAILREYPNFSVVGEEWTMSKTIIARYQKDAQNPDDYNSNLTHLMDFPLLDKTIKALNEPNTWQSSWSQVYESLAHDYLYASPEKQMIFLDNHDETRIYRALNHNFENWKLAMTLISTMRGFPQMLYGTEILMTHPDLGHHAQIRTEFPGGWQGDTQDAFTGKNLSAESKEAQKFLRKLLQFRKNTSTLHNGKLLHYAPENNDCYVYFRYDDNRRIMVVLNKAEESAQLDMHRFTQGLQGAKSGYDIISEKNLNWAQNLTIPAKSSMLIVLD